MRTLSTFCLMAVISLLFVTACASGPTFSGLTNTTSKTSNVYIYKPAGYVGMAVAYPVVFDDKVIGSLGNGSYFLIRTTPGHHVVKIRKESTFLGSGFLTSNEYVATNINVPINNHIFMTVKMTATGTQMYSGGLIMPRYSASLVQVPIEKGLQDITELHVEKVLNIK